MLESKFSMTDFQEVSDAAKDLSDEQMSKDIAQAELDDMTESCAKDLDDDLYHARELTKEELERIDDLWGEKTAPDVEPYTARELTKEDLERIDELWNADNKEIDEQISDINCAETSEFSSRDIKTNNSLADMQETQSLEEKFAADVQSMSDVDLVKEQEKIKELSQMDDNDILKMEDIRTDCDDNHPFDDLMNTLSKEQLQLLRDGLANRDRDILDALGIPDDPDDPDDPHGPNVKKRVLKR